MRRHVVATYVGTDDSGATETDPTGGGADPDNNMVLVTSYEYDHGQAGGDGNLTEQTQHVDADTARVTQFVYDWRNRRTDTDGEIDFYEKLDYDNLDRVTKTERYDTTVEGNLIARSERKYDDRGRVYQTIRYGVDPSTGAVGNALVDHTWYDAAGNAIKSLPSGAKLFTKTLYDGLGRQTVQYAGYDLDETTYAEAGTVVDDTILEETETDYDNASKVIQTTTRQRYHNAPASQTGALGDPSSEPKARVTYTTQWHDAIGREIATAAYGTNGGTALDRPDTIPQRSDTVLLTSTGYNDTGEAFQTIDPAGREDQQFFDAAGRTVKTIQNYVDGTVDIDQPDEDVTVEMTYGPDGQVLALVAKNPATGDQVTRYVYGTTLTDSDIARSDLLRAEIYPDSDDSGTGVPPVLSDGPDEVYDRIEHRYNRQGERRETKDQNETVHAFEFDKLGRQIHDRVTALGDGVDGAVRRISTTYEIRGMSETITSWDDATVGSGNAVNEVHFAYNGFGQITADYQSHAGSVNPSTTPAVQYGYADGSANTIRPTAITYPNGRAITYGYGSTDSMSDALSRIASILDDDAGSTHLADYSYLGVGPAGGLFPMVNFPFTPGAVEVDYTEPDIRYTLVGTAGGSDPDTGDIYRGLDRFARVKDCYWYNYGTSSDVDRIKYGYDRNGNRTWRENVVARSLGKYFDEKYVHDLIDRLQHAERGELDDFKSEIENLQFAQRWGLDATGNWAGFLEDSDGNGTWDLDQTRTANPVNEIVDITEDSGPSWVTPAYNQAGKLTTIPKPAAPTQAFTATYVAWNRLVRLAEGQTTVAQYEYDGAKRRTVTKTYVSGQLDETRHFYYTDPSCWQVVEERVGSSTTAERQFVWGLRYIDDLILRDRDTNADETLDERLYGMQDANWNVTSVASEVGTVQERYAYHPYGTPILLTASFEPRGSSSLNWETTFAGYRWDRTVMLSHVRNRVYNGRMGIWLQRDSLGYASGRQLGLYSYVENKPTGAPDPSGAGPAVVVVVVGGITVGVCSVPPAIIGLLSMEWTHRTHCIVSCWIARNCTSLTSLASGVGWELIPPPLSGDWREDLEANIAGITCARIECIMGLGIVTRWFRKSCQDCCSEAYP